MKVGFFIFLTLFCAFLLASAMCNAIVLQEISHNDYNTVHCMLQDSTKCIDHEMDDNVITLAEFYNIQKRHQDIKSDTETRYAKNQIKLILGTRLQ